MPTPMKIDCLVGFIWFAFSFMYLCMWLLVFIPWKVHSSIGGLFAFLLYHFFYFFCLTSYRMAIFTNPGRVPEGWIDSTATQQELDDAKQLALSDSLSPPHPMTVTKHEKVRYCKMCRQFKPPRSHHCRQCQVCILKMDHHCPYINNCVGFFNQKAFALFLLYTFVGSLFSFMLYIARVVEIINGIPRIHRHDPSNPLSPNSLSTHVVITPQQRTWRVFQLILIIINFAILLFVSVGVGGLGLYQLKIMMRGTTTVERKAFRWAKYDAEQNGQSFRWIYDLGRTENLKSIFGPYFLASFAPSVIKGDGLSFRTCGDEMVAAKL